MVFLSTLIAGFMTNRVAEEKTFKASISERSRLLRARS